MYIWGALKDNVKLSKEIVDNYRAMFESRISAEKLVVCRDKKITSAQLLSALSEQLKHVSLVTARTSMWKTKQITIEL